MPSCPWAEPLDRPGDAAHVLLVGFITLLVSHSGGSDSLGGLRYQAECADEKMTDVVVPLQALSPCLFHSLNTPAGSGHRAVARLLFLPEMPFPPILVSLCHSDLSLNDVTSSERTFLGTHSEVVTLSPSLL